MTQRRSEILLVLVTLLWGGTFAIVKDAMPYTTPSAFVAMRFFVATVLITLMWPRALQRLDRRLLFEGLVLGLLFGIGFQLQTYGLTITSASSSAFITGTSMMFVPVIGWLVSRRHIQKRHGVAIVLVLVGLYGFTKPDVAGVNNGDIATLLSAVVWAAYIVLIDRYSAPRVNDARALQVLIFMQMVVTTAMACLGIVVFDNATIQFELPTSVILALLYCSVFATVIATTIQTRYQSFTQPVRAGLIFATEPIAAALIAVVAFGEVWDVRHLASAALIIAGIVAPDLIALYPSRRRRAAS